MRPGKSPAHAPTSRAQYLPSEIEQFAGADRRGLGVIGMRGNHPRKQLGIFREHAQRLAPRPSLAIKQKKQPRHARGLLDKSAMREPVVAEILGCERIAEAYCLLKREAQALSGNSVHRK